MQIKAIAFTLPNKDKFLVVSHKRDNTPTPLVWQKEYRDQLFELQRYVKDIARGKHLDELNDEQREALYVPGMSPKAAEESIECVWVDAERYGKKLKFLDKHVDSVHIGGRVGYDVQGGMVRYMLVNNGVGYTPTKELMAAIDRYISKGKWSAITPAGKEVPISRFEPGSKIVSLEGTEINFDDIEWRRSQMLIRQTIRFGENALTDGKTFRLVTIPYEARVSIVNSKNREVLREIPRQWS